jgi:hypothetical protein
MTTSRSDLIRAKLLLLVYSGYECIPDGMWVKCNNYLYKQYMADELVREGHFLIEDGKYIMSGPDYLRDDWFDLS